MKKSFVQTKHPSDNLKVSLSFISLPQKTFIQSEYFSNDLNNALSFIGLPRRFLSFELLETVKNHDSILLWGDSFNRVQLNCGDGRIYILNAPTGIRRFVNETLIKALQSEQIARSTCGPVDFEETSPKQYVSELLLSLTSIHKIDPLTDCESGFWFHRFKEALTEARTGLSRTDDEKLVSAAQNYCINFRCLFEDLYGNPLLQ